MKFSLETKEKDFFSEYEVEKLKLLGFSFDETGKGRYSIKYFPVIKINTIKELLLFIDNFGEIDIVKRPISGDRIIPQIIISSIKGNKIFTGWINNYCANSWKKTEKKLKSLKVKK